eukprot:11224551-Lingulodinium_polyedra.AAC.1
MVTELHRSSPFRSGEPPYVAYDPTVPEGTDRALPGTYVHAGSNGLMLSDLSQTHDLQQHSIRLRERRNEARIVKGKGVGKGKAQQRGKGTDD